MLATHGCRYVPTCQTTLFLIGGQACRDCEHHEGYKPSPVFKTGTHSTLCQASEIRGQSAYNVKANQRNCNSLDLCVHSGRGIEPGHTRSLMSESILYVFVPLTYFTTSAYGNSGS